MNKMGQKEIINFLKEYKGEWMTTKEIQYRMNNGNISSVTINLKKLRDANMIIYKREDIRGRSGVPSYLYKYKEIEK